MKLGEELRRLAHSQPQVALREHEPLANHTTFGIGGPADYFTTAHDASTLRQLVQIAREAGAPLLLLGSGSNILVGDGGIRGLVVENKVAAIAVPDVSGDSVRLTADAGVSFAHLARWTARRGLRGLEWAAGIPGTLGGAVVYNAGAYGGCLADVLTAIHALGPDGRERELPAADLSLAYRSSAFTRGLLRDRVILDLTFALRRGDPERAQARIRELETKRKASTPRGRNAGSVFKNPRQHPAWWLMEQVGLRGHRIGGAQVSERHANYILNVNAARAADVAALLALARRRVRDAYAIELDAEVSLVGEGFE